MNKRIPIVAGNWKMNKSVEEARMLMSELSPLLMTGSSVEKVICPPFTALLSVAAMVKGTDIKVGAQNLHWEPKGAYTGEISPDMLAEFCQYVIIGHSERRAYFGETDETANKKIVAAQQVHLTPIFCVGETLKEYEAGETATVVSRQVKIGLRGLGADSVSQLVIAYEPVWAIGTGRASSSKNAEEVMRDQIRNVLRDTYNENVASSVRILYGGSVTASNAQEFFNEPDIDGALVGGASLKAEEFAKIIIAAAD